MVSSVRIIHFGRNPDRGGNPPSDNKIRGVRAVRAGALAQEQARELILREEVSLKVRNVAEVMTRYSASARRVSEGENCSTKIIHPR